MMRGPAQSAIAVRKPDGEIVIDIKPNSSLVKKLKLTKIPIIRGVVAFFDNMIIGMKATMYSASFIDLEEDENQPKTGEISEDSEVAEALDSSETTELSEADKPEGKKDNGKLMGTVMWISVVLALALGIGMFMLLPTLAAGFIKSVFVNETFIQFPQSFANGAAQFLDNRVVLNLLEAVIRMTIFLIYMWLVSKMKDMRRVFAYHGAEHKTIACYEDGEELNCENVRKCTRFHPRCGTSFLLIVMVVSILFFSFLTWGDAWTRMGLRLALLPVVAGLSYEIIKFAGRSKSRVVRWLTTPGIWLQRLTTNEPDDAQIEVAIMSLKAVLPKDGEDDKW